MKKKWAEMLETVVSEIRKIYSKANESKKPLPLVKTIKARRPGVKLASSPGKKISQSVTKSSGRIPKKKTSARKKLD